MRLSQPNVRMKDSSGSHFVAMGGFSQFGHKYLDYLQVLAGNNPAAMQLFIWLTKHAIGSNIVECKPKDICAGTDLSRATVFRALRELEKGKFIARSGNEIHLNAWLVWKGSGPATPFNCRLMAQPTLGLPKLPVMSYTTVKKIKAA
jgi:hypothetical protein